MRLLMLSGDRQTAQGERGPLYQMMRGFHRHFERIDVLSPRTERPACVASIFGNVHLHPSPTSRLGMYRYLSARGSELLKAQRHDLIVSHDYGLFYNGLAAARLSKRLGVPYLSEIHHVPGHPVAVGLADRLGRAIARRYVRWARGKARAFRVVNSQEMLPLLVSWGVPREQIVVIGSLYLDLAQLRPPEQPQEPQREVLFVGRMVHNKGLDRIVDALAALAARGRSARALFVGQGPLLASTQARVRRLGLSASVSFEPWIEDDAALAKIYRESRTLVCASTCEGGPRVVAEAMACGTPCVSTPVGMMKELLRDGENGVSVGFSAESLTQGIERMLADETQRRAMGRQAALDVLQFDHASAIATYAEGLKRLAGAAPNRSR
jgi:glycosyltransferase involved in cell wall biosynthesis